MDGTEPFRTCSRGHQYRGDENYRARSGRCPVCFRDVQRRYDNSPKRRAASAAYDASDKGKDRKSRYMSTPKGWLARLRERRSKALVRKAARHSSI